MNDLKTLNDQLAEVRRQQSDLASRLGELGAGRHSLETAATDSAANIAAAEQNLIEQLAAAELGEQSDTAGAEKALNDAKAQAANGIETAQRLRVLDALRQRFEGEHAAHHEKGVAIVAAIKTAEAERLVEVAHEIHNDIEAAFETISQAEPRLNAVRSLLSEYGHSWPLPQINELAIRSRFNTSPNQARASVLAEINHA